MAKHIEFYHDLSLRTVFDPGWRNEKQTKLLINTDKKEKFDPIMG